MGWVKSVDTQNRSVWRAAEKIETRSGQKIILPCVGVRHFVRSYPSHARSSKFEPCSLSKLTYLSLQALSLHTLFEHQIHHFFSSPSLFFLLPHSLFSLLTYLLAWAEQHEHGEPLGGHCLLGKVGPSMERSACVPRCHRSERSLKETASREIGGVEQHRRPSFSSPTSAGKSGHTHRGSRGVALRVVVAYGTQGGGRRRGAERGCALRRGSALTHELLHGGRAWRHDSSRSAQR
jgi:hypothetical protein